MLLSPPRTTVAGGATAARLVLGGAFLAAALFPLAGAWRAQFAARALDDAAVIAVTTCAVPALAPERATGLASWQTIGGCGAGASTGSATGIKWIGRGTTGGLFNFQCQNSYTTVAPQPHKTEHHVVSNLLFSRGFGDRFVFGVNVPLVFKYMRDPLDKNVDLSNSGVGDVSAMFTGKLGPIGATALTATVGIPTGEYNGSYKTRILNQSQQRGFGKPTASLMLDHTADETWGITVVGATAAWRGGQNEIDNYRAPSGSIYGYVGGYFGALVPAIGLSLTGLTDHDRDQTVEQRTGLYLAAANLSIEWSTDWVALLVGASFPYQYDGFDEDEMGVPRSPWGWGPWMVGLGLSFSPF